MKALAILSMTLMLSLFAEAKTLPAVLIPMDTTESDIDFGEVPVGDYGLGDIYAKAGDQALQISEITVTGDMFSVAHNCPTELAVGKTCHIIPIFEPTAEGDYKGDLTVKTSAGDYLFHLMGSGSNGHEN